MAEPAKFTFDTVFDVAGRATPLSAHNETKQAEAVAAAHAAGFAEGRAQALAATETRAAAALQALAANMETVTQTLEDERAALTREAVELAMAGLRKLAPALTAREPLAEIEALFIDCLDHLRDAPHIVIRVEDTLVEPLSRRIGEIAAERGFAGKTVILGEPQAGPGDCRIEWADGGAVRDGAALAAHIDEAVTCFLKTRSEPGPRDLSLEAQSFDIVPEFEPDDEYADAWEDPLATPGAHPHDEGEE